MARQHPSLRPAASLAWFAAAALTASSPGQTTGLTPLIDFAPSETYQGYEGGLYPGARDYGGGAHLRAGLLLAQRMRPVDAAGRPSPDGRIVMISVGMSNTSQESSAFAQMLAGVADLNPSLVFVNGAQGGQDARAIAHPEAAYWDNLDQRLAQAGVTPLQVQTVWYKEAIARPDDPFPQHAWELRDLSKTVMQIIKDRYPNATLAYASSRIFAGYATTNLNPEPYAYESGFSIKWLIEDQIDGDPALNFRPAAGDVLAPRIQWAAYLWADGLNPRSDGLIWEREDFGNDGTHPSPSGREKAARLLIDFFTADPTARLWFLAPGVGTLLADMNGDGEINAFDIEGFTLALVDPVEYASRHPGIDPVAAGDVNQDGVLDAFDIEAFIELLLGS